MKRNTAKKSIKKTSKNAKVNEPSAAYKTKRITFSSLEEQEKDNYRYWLSLTPEQRIENVTFLINNIYKDQPKKRTNRIIFDNP